MKPIQVAIIDNDYYARWAITGLLTRDRRTEVVASLESPYEALKGLKRTPDIVLLDLDFKQAIASGLQAITQLKSTFPRTKILILSMHQELNLICEAIKAGVDGYLWKNDTAEGLGSAIARANRGVFVVTESIMRLIFGKIGNLLGQHKVAILPKNKKYDHLTEREAQVMKLFCFEGLSTDEIAEVLHISKNTVRRHLRLGYKILGVTNRHEAFQKLVARADE
ncbi:MAG: response regulator transcription factor [Anaerolineae bacterium]